MVDKPEMREIATTLDGQDITRGFVDPMMLAPPQDMILLTRAGGDYNVYRELLRDDQVGSTFGQRRLAVVSSEWEVQPGGDSSQDKAAADFLREQLKNIRWDSVTDKMLFGVFYGFAVAECLWAKDGQHIVLDAIKVRDRKRFGFDESANLRLLTMANPTGEIMPDRKFWAFRTGADHDDDPYGMGLAHWLYWPVFFKRNGIKFWLIFLEKFGQPTSKGKYPENATPAEKQKLLQALRAIHTDSGIILPEGMAIELIEAARSGTADYTALYDRMDRAIAKVVLGQVASTEGTPGRLGNDSLQQDVREDLVKADGDIICDSFNRSVARWLTEWNFPNAAVPSVWRKTEDVEDLTEVSTREKNIFDMGYRPTLQHIQDTYGGEWEPIPPPQSPQPPAFAELGASASDAPLDIVDTQVAQLSQDTSTPIDNLVAVLRELLDKANTLEDFQQSLIEAYPKLTTEQLADVMAKALTAAELAGRYDILEQALGS